MKTTNTILLFLLVTCSGLAAQNWEPFSVGESYHYFSGATTFPDRTVRVESASNMAGDSIWEFNRLWEQAGAIAMINGANIGGRSVRLQGGGLYQFRDSSNIALPTWANVGDTWLMDSVQMLSGEVVRIDAYPVLGQMDSVKVIAVGGDTLQLSKAHGIVEWPAVLGGSHFILAGIQERHLGDTLPGFDGFFHFKVGDILCYTASYVVGNGGGGSDSYQWQTRVEITDARRDSLGLHLDCRWVDRLVINGFPGTGHLRTRYWGISDRPDGLVERGNHEPIRFPRVLTSYVPPFFAPMLVLGLDCPYFASNAEVYMRSDYSETNGLVQLQLGPSSYPAFYVPTAPNSPACSTAWSGQRVTFTEGLGMNFQTSGGFEESGEIRMVGRIIDGDTVGTIFEESYLLSVVAIDPMQSKTTIDWALFPNPAHETTQIKLDAGIKGELRILDMTGRTLKQAIPVVNGSSIDVRALPAGVYQVQLQTRNAIGMKLLQIVR
jgi:Secretion system C-terminal sorting domain